MTTGYCEIEHTADWEIHVWGPDFVSLLETAARGMYALSETQLMNGPRFVRGFEISSEDRETMLIDFLDELLFYGEHEGIAFDRYQLNIYENTLRVRASGAPILHQAKEIKAVTFHNIHIQDVEEGLEVSIVFDV